jgi:outer membrane protein assembly factor BamD
MRKYNLSFVLVFLVLIQGCAFLENAKVDPYENMVEETLYSQGSIFLENGDIPSAITVFETLEAKYPFSTYSQQSVLDLAYAYYDFGQKDDTIAECDRFIDLYPNHPNLDYAYYLRALSNLEKEQPFFQDILGQDVSKYDVTRLKNAYNDFIFIVNRFNKSKYADDAQNRLVFLRDSMAKHEVYIAKYYLKRGAYLASSERAKYILEKYPGAPATKEALLVLIKSYNNLGLLDSAKVTADILVKNFPNYSYEIGNNSEILISDINERNIETNNSFFKLDLF